MLSVNEGRSRARSKSRERSRTRDARASSPAARAPPPPTRRSKQAYESDSEAISDEESDGARYEHRNGGGRYDNEKDNDHRRRNHEDDRNKDTRRKEYHGGNDERSSGYANVSKYQYGRSEKGRREGYSKDEDKELELPGTYKEYDDQKSGLRGGEQYSISSPTEGSYRSQTGRTSSKGAMYSQPSKYEYAKAPSEVRYLSKGESLGSVDHGLSYTSKPSAEIEIERRRHRRDKEMDDDLDEDAELERQYAEMQRQKKKKELEDTELVRKYERELGYARKNKESERKQIMYKDDDSSDEQEYRYQRRKHSDEEKAHDDKRRHETTVDKKYRESEPIEPKDKRVSQSRHDSKAGAQVLEIRPRGNSDALKPLESGVRRLSVSAGAGSLSLAAPGGHRGPIGGGLPPGSPLLEAYHGTYQSISPMPSPMALPSFMDDGLSDLEPLEDDDQHHIIKPKKGSSRKRVEIYDAEADAKVIGNELNSRKPSAAPLIKILPALSDDNMMALRTEYKKHFKSQGKGINVAKHIKVKFVGNVGKIAYATSLGRWESEAHWANFWYQAGSSRRELLIESLLGRTNLEIRHIKDAFSDKRYNDSLEKCMQTELKKDKFRHAVLLALEEKRMDEIASISKSQVRADVDALHRALTAREGGETAMIDIIVVRSDNHLREVLRDFEFKYKANFARQMIAKSQNLVVSIENFLACTKLI